MANLAGQKDFVDRGSVHLEIAAGSCLKWNRCTYYGMFYVLLSTNIIKHGLREQQKKKKFIRHDRLKLFVEFCSKVSLHANVLKCFILKVVGLNLYSTFKFLISCY